MRSSLATQGQRRGASSWGDNIAVSEGKIAIAARELPRWPLSVMFVLFPLWWLLGPGEAMWIPLAGVMLLFLRRHGKIQTPRGFGIWLLFLLWMACSVIAIDTPGRLAGF